MSIFRNPSIIREYPSRFWVLVLTGFIDNLGRSFLYPFFTLYITEKFELQMVGVGGIFALFAAANLVGSLLSGAITDAVGRKAMILIGLIASAGSSLFMGTVDQLAPFYFAVILVGLFGNSSEPAQQVMIADLLPEEKHAQGFGIWRVSYNLAMAIGPMLGGLLAMFSFMWLFVLDAFFSLVTAMIVLVAIPETRRDVLESPSEDVEPASVEGGYLSVMRDGLFMVYLLAVVLFGFVDVQLTSTLPVFLTDVHHITPAQYGYLMGFNAGLVVLFQIFVTKKASRYPKMLMMAVGAGLYMLGFAMFGFVSSMVPFFVAVFVITLGEMVTAPIAQALVIRFAPLDKRGRYIAFYESSWLISYAGGPFLAGLVMDHLPVHWVWYAAGLVACMAAIQYFWLYRKMGAPRKTETISDQKMV